jgi:hypothetical protein
MSIFPTRGQASEFLAPLRRNLVILLLHDIQAKTQLSRFILGCASLESLDTTILDTDAFYSSNIDKLIDRGDDGIRSIPRAEVLLLSEEGDFEVTSLLPLISSNRRLIIIDDLNSLYSLATAGGKSNQLRILMKLLSYNARMNDSWVIATAYRTELTTAGGGSKQEKTNRRSLTALGDLLVETYSRDGSLKLKSEFTPGYWPDNEFEL